MSINAELLEEATVRLADTREAAFRDPSGSRGVSDLVSALQVDEDALAVWTAEAIQTLITEQPENIAIALPAALINGFLVGVIAGRLEPREETP